MDGVAKKPSSKDVARRAGVSQATVSYVFSGRSAGLVSSANRERVLAAAEEIGYRPNGLARSLQTGRTNCIGVFLSYIGSYFHASIVSGAAALLGEHDYKIVIAAAEDNHTVDASKIDFLLSQRVDALMVIGGAYYQDALPDWMRYMQTHKIAGVVVDDKRCAGMIDCVVSDDLGGMRKLVAHLASKGHRRIAALTRVWTSSTALDREEGYRLGLIDCGLPYDEALAIPCCGSKEDIQSAVKRLLALPDPPTALLCPADPLAPIAWSASLRMGGKLTVTGFGNELSTQQLDLISVDQQPYAMGRTAAQMLLDRLQHPESAPRLVVKETSVAEREISF
jgi:LacI family transcriptional regulator